MSLLFIGIVWNATGQVRMDDPVRFLVWAKSDTQAIPGALLHTSPLKLALGTASVITAMQFDSGLSQESASWSRRELMRVLEELGDANAARPLALVIFTGSLFTEHHRFQDAAFTSFQSLVYANVLTNALKLGFGRQRPWQGPDDSEFKPFGGNTSFPSGHATTAFAAVTPWILYYPGPASIVAVIVAGGTAFSRIPLQFHWPSDVLAGALVGFSTSAWLYRRHTRSAVSDNFIVRVSPTTVQVQFRW